MLCSFRINEQGEITEWTLNPKTHEQCLVKIQLECRCILRSVYSVICAYVWQGSNLTICSSSRKALEEFVVHLEGLRTLGWLSRGYKKNLFCMWRVGTGSLCRFHVNAQEVYRNLNWKKLEETRKEQGEVSYWMKHMTSSQLARCINIPVFWNFIPQAAVEQSRLS